MVMQHDDVVTRMKNVEMIELGLNRISPWYFSPYPQVKKRLKKCRRSFVERLMVYGCIKFDKLLHTKNNSEQRH